MCKVSICIPAYNSVSLIKRLLDSIDIQSYKDYEVVITDDSNTDDVRTYVNSLGNSKIRYYKNSRQLGATANCNEVISKASGEYIKIMHHDDWFTDCNSLGNFVKMLDDNLEADIAFSGTNQVCGANVMSRYIADDKVKALHRSYRTLYDGNWIGAPSATIMRNKGFFFDTKLKWLVDVELYLRILGRNPKFAYTNEPLVSIGVGDLQLSRSCEYNWKLQAEEYNYILRKLRLYKYADCVVLYMKTCMRYWLSKLKII